MLALLPHQLRVWDLIMGSTNATAGERIRQALDRAECADTPEEAQAILRATDHLWADAAGEWTSREATDCHRRYHDIYSERDDRQSYVDCNPMEGN